MGMGGALSYVYSPRSSYHRGYLYTTGAGGTTNSSDANANGTTKAEPEHGGTCRRIKVTRVCTRIDPSDTTLTVKDGYQWRKYGQKVTHDKPSPSAYFRCACAPSCPVKKKVQRSAEDSSVLVATYEGEHNHLSPTRARGELPRAATPPRLLSSAGYLYTGADEPPQARREGAQLEPRVGGLHARVMPMPSSIEGPFLRAGGSPAPAGPKTLGQQEHRRCSAESEEAIKLVQPQPIKQPAENSCVPVAVAVCIDTLHRFNHEMEHGKGTFPYKAAVPHDLILACRNAKIWNPDSGSIPPVHKF